MLIDSHCHIDLFPNPEKIVDDAGAAGVGVVAVTNLPSNFVIALDRLKTCRHVRPALGMHPLCAADGVRELALFRRLAVQADLIGEIGLDFSPQGIAKKAIQERVFDEVLSAVSDRPRFITLHSRGAEKEVLAALKRLQISRAVFHWFTGSRKDLVAVLSAGYAVSVNPAMLHTASGKRVLEAAPAESILVETDGPFAKQGARSVWPGDTAAVYRASALRWNISVPEAVSRVEANSRRYGLEFPGLTKSTDARRASDAPEV